MKLNLGATDRRFDGYISVDIVQPAEIHADLTKPWPWSDSSIEEVLAYDIFEHLPDKIHTMNELWRVLKPGCVAQIEVPCASHGAGAFQDPTHRSFWTMNDFQYYQEGSFARRRFAGSYGIRARFFINGLTEQQVPDQYESVYKIHVMLEAVK